MRRLMSALAGALFITALVACNGGSGSVPSKPGARDPEAFVPANTTAARGTQTMRQIHVPQTTSDAHARHTLATNILSDPGFESGGFASWGQCGNVNAAMSTTRAHTGTYSARGGSAGSTSGEINGDAGVCQQVTIPASGVLTFWYYGFSNESSTTYSYQEAELFDSSGVTVKMLWQAELIDEKRVDAKDRRRVGVCRTDAVLVFRRARRRLQRSVHDPVRRRRVAERRHADADAASDRDTRPHGDADAGRHTDAEADRVPTPKPTATPSHCHAEADRDADRRPDADPTADRRRRERLRDLVRRRALAREDDERSVRVAGEP